jgi:histidinol-phosphate aminotransferase
MALAMRMLREDMLEKQRELLGEIRESKQYLLEILATRDFILEIIPGDANFVLVRVANASELLAFCAGQNVILRSFPTDPLLDGYLRISVGTREDLARLADVLDDWENRK